MKLSKKFKIPFILALLSGIICLAIIIIYNVILYTNSDTQKVKDFTSTINHRYLQNDRLLQQLVDKYTSPDFQQLKQYSEILPAYTNLFVFNKEDLLFWSDNSIPYDPSTSNKRIIQTPNGYFQQNSIQKGNYRFILLDLIKYKYPYQNDYLMSSFNPAYSVTPDCEINLNSGQLKITDNNDRTLFYINKTGKSSLTNNQEFLLYTLSLLVFVLFNLALYLYLKTIGIRAGTSLFIVALTSIFLRIILFKAGVPHYFSDFDLFSPLNYASSIWLSSLGDLLTNVVIFTFLSYLAYRTFRNELVELPGKIIKASFIIVSFAIITLFYYLSLYIIDTLVINSSFELNLSKLLDFSIYSITAYFIIGLVLLNFFYISYILVRITSQITGKFSFLVYFICFSLIVWLVFRSSGLYIPQWQELILFILYIGLLVAIVSKILPYPHVTTYTLLIIILTLISTFCLYHNREAKEKEERKLMALRLSSEQDKIGEYLYSDIEKAILKDSTVYNLFMRGWYYPVEEENCINYLNSHYFTGYWSKYNSQITLCYPDKHLVVKPSDVIVECTEYFNNIIDNITNKTSAQTLHYFKESFGVNNYIAKIPINNQAFKGDTASIIIEFTQKYVPKGLGYPELLLDKSFISFYDLSLYSYAIYSNNELIKNVGEYSYSISEKPFLPFRGEYSFFDKNDYNHLYHSVNKNTSIVISKKKQSLLDQLAPFTYQLIFHIILIFILTSIYSLRHFKRRYPDLKTQLQIMLVALVLFASLIIGATTLHNIRSLNDKKNKDMLSEKAHSVLIEIEHKLDTFQKIDSSNEPYLHELLTKFSLVFFSDINLYTTKGNLLATSRPEIFKEGLRSEFMSTEAYNEISVNRRTFFVTNEQIGTYKYLSAYIPFRNKDNQLIAYINLPYFARENELRTEISSFLVTFVNVYIMLTAIAVLAALVVGNYVTRPLQLIRDRFSHVMLDKKNEKITYNRHDEIGNLINEYNLMLEKLSESVDKLAQSERESAWKEMARQIAHEIKNPLTPMKLSIQHLYRSYHDKAPDWELKLEKTTTSLIQQIDSLASIASAFSDFAKFPQPSNENIELLQLIKDNVALFQPQTEFDITFRHNNQPQYVYADKKQLSRVMVNLLNNAIQSIPADKKGRIEILLETRGDQHVISISDNGIGIAEELKHKIFSPNFTTKSGGAGLGLAMVKNIINSAKGNIIFTSDDNGTTFEIHLPAVKPDNINKL